MVDFLPDEMNNETAQKNDEFIHKESLEEFNEEAGEEIEALIIMRNYLKK